MVTAGLKGLALFIALIGLAMIFKKMGIKWWKAFIPVYGEYVLFKEVWDKDMFFVALAGMATMNATSSIVAACHLQHAAMGMALLGLGAVAGIATLVITVMLLHKVAKAFGHGKGYTAGLVLLPPVFFNVLGFDESEYQAA